MITEEEICEISCLAREDGRQKLLQCMGWRQFDDEEDLRRSIVVDFLYDCISFCINRVFLSSEICLMFQLSYELINCVKTSDLPGALNLYKLKSVDLSPFVDQHRFTSFTDFIYSTFFHHFRLYRSVMTTARDCIRPQVSLCVSVPPPVPPAAERKELPMWEYEEAMKEIERREAERKVQWEAVEGEERERRAREGKDIQKRIDSLQCPIGKKDLINFIHDAAGVKFGATSRDISYTIKKVTEDLSFKLEKAVVPRPDILGVASNPPPTSPKSPKSRKSPKAGSKK